MKLAIISLLVVFEPLILVTAIILVEKAWRRYQWQ
jgi:hypothetical protein